MSKQKSKKPTFWSRYKTHIIVIVAAAAIVYFLIYLVFRGNGIFPVGADLEKSDWLSFLGAYLSFIGTVIVSMIAIFQSRYYSELNEKKDASSRKKEIQPIFSIKIVAIDIQLDGTAEAFSLSDKSKNPVHKNVKISVENVNRFPIKHVIIFDKYITPLLKCNEVQFVHCAYYDSDDAKKWPSKVAVLTDEYERNDRGVPKWSFRKISALAATFVLVISLSITAVFVLNKEPEHIAQDVFYSITISYENEQYGYFSNRLVIDKYGLNNISDLKQNPDLFTGILTETDIIQTDSVIDKDSIIGAKIYPYSDEVIILQGDGQFYYFEKIVTD